MMFEYGVIVFWGLTEGQEREVMEAVVAEAEIDPLEDLEEVRDCMLSFSCLFFSCC
jgi:uncharacterized Rmd1/YagE family protein